MVADKFTNGCLVLIRTRDGWSAYLGNFKPHVLKIVEMALDEKVPNYGLPSGKESRQPTLTKELERLLPDCGFSFPGYYPMKFIDDLEE
jgi:hypothetical protein